MNINARRAAAENSRIARVALRPGLKIILPLCAAWLCAVAPPARALTVMAQPDDAMFRLADAVIAGTVAGISAQPGDELGATRYRVTVGRTYKGDGIGAEVDLRVAGALDPTQPGALIVPDAPRFTQSEQVLLFLHRRAGGSWVIAQFALGAFHVLAAADGEAVLERELDDAHEIARNGAALLPDEHNQRRSAARFEKWMDERAAGREGDAAYWVAVTAVDALQRTKFAVAGNPPVRWFEFDQGGSVTLYAGATGQAGMAGGGYAEFVQAIAAWNDDPGSNVRYVYGGISGAGGGLRSADGVNQILFNDPDGDLGGAFDCASGGLIAYSGFRSSGTRSFGGRLFQRLVEADTVVQDGAGCMLSGLQGSNAAELFAHELGHTLGLSHPCGDAGVPACAAGTAQDDALMRPYMHSDGRGAQLGNDDRAGLAWLYPADGVPASAPDAVNNGDAAQGGGGGGGGGGAFGLLPLCLLLAARGARSGFPARWKPSVCRALPPVSDGFRSVRCAPLAQPARTCEE